MMHGTNSPGSDKRGGIKRAVVGTSIAVMLAAPALAHADPISPAPSPGGAGQLPPVVVVAATPGGAGQPTLVISPPTDAQPGGPARINPIGGARIGSSAPVEMGPGNGKPLTGAVPRTAATLPVFARNGIFVKTGLAGQDLTVHLPDEMLLAPAAWGPNGMATYSNDNNDFVVTPLPDGGADFVVRKKNGLAPASYEYFLKLPRGMYGTMEGDRLVIKSSEAGAGAPAATVGTFSPPTAKNAGGAAIPVSSSLSPLGELTVDAGSPGVFDHPIEISISYHPNEIAQDGVR
ncbi:MAG: hypothetical protein ACRDDJ_04295 [[Mycobacterium] stephanolepidis]